MSDLDGSFLDALHWDMGLPRCCSRCGEKAASFRVARALRDGSSYVACGVGCVPCNLVIYLSPDGPADYRICVASKRFSARDAAALIVVANGAPRRLAAAAL